MRAYIQNAQNWFTRVAGTIHAQLWLVGLSFTESSIFVIPPDPLLAAMVFVHKEKWVRYTTITAVASIAGAVFGYVVGAVLFDTVGVKIVAFYSLQAPMAEAIRLVHNGVFLFTLTMAFTPIPFKVAVLAAGFTKANFIPFFIATVGGRVARYAFVAYTTKIFGTHAAHIMRRFWRYATAIGIVIVIGYIVYVYVF